MYVRNNDYTVYSNKRMSQYIDVFNINNSTLFNSLLHSKYRQQGNTVGIILLSRSTLLHDFAFIFCDVIIFYPE